MWNNPSFKHFQLMGKNKTAHMSAFQQLPWSEGCSLGRTSYLFLVCHQPPHAKLEANGCGLSRGVGEGKYFKTTHFRVYDFQKLWKGSHERSICSFPNSDFNLLKTVSYIAEWPNAWAGALWKPVPPRSLVTDTGVRLLSPSQGI